MRFTRSLPTILTISICICVVLFSAHGEPSQPPPPSIIMTLDEEKFGKASEAERLEAARAIAERHNMTVKV